MASKSCGDFFAVDSRAWASACSLGLNEAVAYLVLARGSGGDQRTTSWSVHAIEKYTGISRPRGEAAVRRLIEAGMIRLDQKGCRPRYFILPAHEVPRSEAYPPQAGIKYDQAVAQSPLWIWLPNTIIDGAANETPPVEMLRQTQDTSNLMLFVEMYAAHRLVADGGIHWQIIREAWKRHKAHESGAAVVWAFEPDGTTAFNTQFVARFMTGKLVKKKEGGRRDAGWPVFWEAWRTLRRLGLFEFVPHVIDSDLDTAEIIHPYTMSGRTTGAERVGYAAQAAGEAILRSAPEFKFGKWVDSGEYMLLPAFAHQKNIQMVGIARLVYRPRTAVTAAWLARNDEWEQLARYYDEVAKTGRMQHQGLSRIYQRLSTIT